MLLEYKLIAKLSAALFTLKSPTICTTILTYLNTYTSTSDYPKKTYTFEQSSSDI